MKKASSPDSTLTLYVAGKSLMLSIRACQVPKVVEKFLHKGRPLSLEERHGVGSTAVGTRTKDLHNRAGVVGSSSKVPAL